MLGTTGRSRNTSRMNEILEAEGQSESSDGEPKKKRRKRTAKGKGKVVDSDLEGDPEYLGSSSESGSVTDVDGETEDIEISNIEVSGLSRSFINSAVALSLLIIAGQLFAIKNHPYRPEAIFKGSWKAACTSQKASASSRGRCGLQHTSCCTINCVDLAANKIKGRVFNFFLLEESHVFPRRASSATLSIISMNHGKRMVKEIQEIQAIHIIDAFMVLAKFLPSRKQAIIISTVSIFTNMFPRF